VFVADNLAKVANAAFDPATQVSGDVALMGVYAFAFQIFGDFAGYSSIAIGLSKLMGFELMTNFRFPYFVTNPADFWKHWHISLSSWLRDYLYIPLGGSRGTRFSLYRNLFLTMLLGGLWHGAAWNFVIWGVYQGGILIAHRMLKPQLDKISFTGWSARAWWLLRVVFMFQVICVGWLIFRSRSVEQIGSMLGGIFTMQAISPLAVTYAIQILFFTWLLLLLQIIQIRRNDLMATQKLSGGWRAILFMGMYFLMATWGEYGGQEFIYFQF
jgi:D-alanyl-lipoteichoic acid acyltransferase DltB (MBOAT superfamily)